MDMKKELYFADPNNPRNQEAMSADELVWTLDETEAQEFQKIFIGKIPIMLKSAYCHLSKMSEADCHQVNECPYDQVFLSYF